MCTFTKNIKKLSRAMCFCLVLLLPTGMNAQAFKVLAFYNGTWDGGHIGYIREALQYFPTLAGANNFSWEATNDWSKLNTANLANYKVIMFLDDACPSAQRAAFETYMNNGGAWIGCHVTAFNTDPNSWSWYYNTFLGMGAFKTNTWGPTTCPMTTVNPTHPVNAGIPATWTGPVNEYYGWNVDVSTKSNFKVLQSLVFTSGTAPVGSDPNQQWRSGSWPLVWTNTNYKMIYTNFGHNLVDYANNNANLSYTHSSATYNKLILNSILWLAGTTTTIKTYAVPGTVEAENFNSMAGIQTETTTDAGGGSNVGWIDANDNMTYRINVATAGTYKVEYRVASLSGGGAIQLDKGANTTAYGSISVASTGGWQTWSTISHNITLAAGTQDIRLLATSGGFNLNWIKFSSASTPVTTTTIQAESYNSMFGIQTETTADAGGGQNVGWIDANDWLLYNNINIATSGTYTIEYRVASLSGGGGIQIEKGGGSPVYGSITVPSTGGWQTWNTIKHTVTLTAGVQSFGLKALTAGFNLNWFAITAGTKSATMSIESADESVSLYPNPVYNNQFSIRLSSITENENVRYKILDLTGKEIYSNSTRLESSSDIDVTLNGIKPGIYMVLVETSGVFKTQKLIVR
jgi:hypothetical protein